MNDLVNKVVKNLGFDGHIEVEEKSTQLAFVLRDEDTRPLKAPWWKGKESYIIAGHINCNFFLRHCGGYVVYWNHTTKEEIVVAKSVNDFMQAIKSE